MVDNVVKAAEMVTKRAVAECKRTYLGTFLTIFNWIIVNFSNVLKIHIQIQIHKVMGDDRLPQLSVKDSLPLN